MVRKFLEDIFRRKLDVLHSARVIHTLYQQQKKGRYCDLKVIVGDRQYFVHRCILASASAQLDAQINGLDTIQLVGVSNYGFERLLEILYSGKMAKVATVDPGKFHEIVSAADALNAENVIEYCARERSDLMKLVIDQSPDPSKTAQSAANVADVSAAESPAMDSPATDIGEGMMSSNEPSPAPLIDPPMPNVFSSTEKHDLGPMEEQRMPDWDAHVKQEPVVVAEAFAGNIAADVEIDETGLSKGAISQPSETLAGGQEYISTGLIRSEGGTQMIQTSRPPMMTGSLKKSIKCTICKRMFSTPHHLKAHMKKHSSSSVIKPYRCETCGMKFSFHTTLISHMKLHEVKRFVCKMCGKDFKLNRNLQLHIQNVHSEKLDVNAAQEPAVHSLNSPPKSKPETDDLKSIVEDVQPGIDGKYTCPLCGKGFSRRWNLKCHVLTHSENRGPRPKFPSKNRVRLECPECGMSSQSSTALQKHVTLVHPHSETFYSLSNASTSFQKEVPHVGEATTPPVVFWCNVCGRGFRRLRNLRSHMETHSGLGYECHICGRSFAQKDGLNGHLWIHGGLGGSKTTPNQTVDQPQNWNQEIQSDPAPT